MRDICQRLQLQLIQALEKHQPQGARAPYLLAISGGKDSTVLLDLFQELSKRRACSFGVAYIHHGLREEADSELTALSEQAVQNGYAFHFAKCNARVHAQSHKLSIEEAARELRLEHLLSIASTHHYGCIVTAHTKSDNAETILMRFIKGSLADGLAGMRTWNGTILRPLLETTTGEIYAYIEAKQLPYFKDFSNDDTALLRNALRHEIIPLIKRLCNAGFDETISRNAVFWESLQEYTASELIFPEISEDMSFSRATYKACNHTTRYYFVKKLLSLRTPQERLAYPRFLDIDRKISSLSAEFSEKIARNLYFKCTYDRVSLCSSNSNTPNDILEVSVALTDLPSLSTFGTSALSISVEAHHSKTTFFTSDRAQLDWDKVTEQARSSSLERLYIRAPKHGDRLTPCGCSGSKSVFRYLSDKKVPRSERMAIPLVVLGSQILAVIGHTIDEHYRISEATARVLKIVVIPETL